MPDDRNWQPITESSPADGEPVLTKIHDGYGARNEAVLVRRGRLWFLPDGSMYVYYTPTHYLPAVPATARAAP